MRVSDPDNEKTPASLQRVEKGRVADLAERQLGLEQVPAADRPAEPAMR